MKAINFQISKIVLLIFCVKFVFFFFACFHCAEVAPFFNRVFYILERFLLVTWFPSAFSLLFSVWERCTCYLHLVLFSSCLVLGHGYLPAMMVARPCFSFLRL